jgi:hypothetical protein
VVPAKDQTNFCPNLGGCGALRRGLATKLLDADVNFGKWRIRLTALDARVRALPLDTRDFEGVTNVGQALIASQLLNLRTTQQAVSQLIIGIVGAGHGYSQGKLSQWFSTAQGIVTKAASRKPI